MSEFYFGKISKNYDPGQLTGGYYEAALSSSWFNGLKISDYVLVVGGDKVQFWQAKQYKGDRMEFNIIINDCGIKPQKLASLIYFKLDMELIIKSMRSTTKEKKAFFKLQPLPQFGKKLVNLLKNKSNYTNASNYRNIILYSDYSELQKDPNNRDNDIQLYYENGEIKIEKKKKGFIDEQLLDRFNGSIKSNSFIGGKNKAKIIKKFDLAGAKTKIVDVSMRDFYDVFISKQALNTSSSNEGLLNGNNANYNDDDVALNLILYGPPGTGKTYNTLFKALEIIEGKTREDLDKEKNEQDEKWKKDTNNPKIEKKGYEVLKGRYDDCIKKGQIVFTTFHQSMSYEDFIEGIKPIVSKSKKQMTYEVKDGVFKQICDKAEKEKSANYVLIIDEINRGNVAQIFGELITLLEPNKRLGNSEEMKAILPYSSAQKGEPVYFGVPNNLYIIGTMNTADRSVEALDTALRRRFDFEEMMPKPELLTKIELTKGDPTSAIDLKEVLEKINDRIIVLKDREHQIGHSYFMGHDDKNEDGSDKYQNKEEWLTNVFKDKIIPLLQEYFYGDYKKIYYVLGGSETEGEGFVKIDSVKSDIFAVKIDDFEYDIPEKRYEIQKIDDTFDIDRAIKVLLGTE